MEAPCCVIGARRPRKVGGSDGKVADAPQRIGLTEAITDGPVKVQRCIINLLRFCEVGAPQRKVTEAS
jgi:hypothetical protein